MIVRYITDPSDPGYNKEQFTNTAGTGLFDLANAQSPKDDNNVTINVVDLNSYFKALPKLQGYRFIRMPADEPLFEIDANSRTITVPQVFSKNGLGVAGDHAAEVVFFRIDRFFDSIDLDALVDVQATAGNDNGCFIQWQNGSASGVSKAYAFDVIDDKLIFGWIIDSNITANAGSVNFSVRFIAKNTNNVTYSFSTLTASCPVKAGLNFSQSTIFNDATDLSALMRSRTAYSNVVNTSDGAKPVITTDLPLVADFAGTTSANTKIAMKANSHDETTNTDAYTLSIVAASPDSGTLSYQWFKGAPSGGAKSIVSGATTSSLDVRGAGTYMVKIGNSKIANNKTIVRYIESETVQIPAPAPITLTTSPATGFAGSNAGVSVTNTIIYGTITKLSAACSGANAGDVVKYQWQLYNGTAWTDISNANSSEYTLTQSEFTMDVVKTYRCKMTNVRNQTSTDPIYTESASIYAFPIGMTANDIDLVKVTVDGSTYIELRFKDSLNSTYSSTDPAASTYNHSSDPKNMIFEWAYNQEGTPTTGGYAVGTYRYAYNGAGTYQCRVTQQVTTSIGQTLKGTYQVITETFD